MTRVDYRDHIKLLDNELLLQEYDAFLSKTITRALHLVARDQQKGRRKQKALLNQVDKSIDCSEQAQYEELQAEILARMTSG